MYAAASRPAVSHIKEKAETEFEKYRIIQDRLFKSDFDKEIMKQLPKNNKND